MKKIIKILMIIFLLFVPSVVLGAEKKCVYTNDDSKIKVVITIDTDIKNIKSTRVTSYYEENKVENKIVPSNNIKYDQIYKNDSCIKISEMWVINTDHSIGNLKSESWSVDMNNFFPNQASKTYAVTFNGQETLNANQNIEPDNTLQDSLNEALKKPFDETKDDDGYNAGMEVEGCDVVPEVIQKWIKIALNFIKYIALVLVVALGTLDFIKAASSGEADGMKKAGQAFIKRLVAVILLFLLPMLVELILNLINLYGANTDCFGVLS